MALVPTASPDSLTRQLQTDPQLADCAVVERTVAGVLQHIAFVVPKETLEPGQRFRAAEEHALLSGIACTVVPLDRLPLRDDGELDEAYLRELPLPLPAAAACAEQTLRAQPGVEHAAVLVLPRKEREPRLHLDTFPCAQRGSHQGLTQAEPVPLLDREELGSSLEQARPLSLCESPALEAKADEPRTLPESLARAAARADANRLLFVEDDGSESALTPGELWQEAHSIMAGLRSAGLLAGDFVLLPVVRPRDVLPAFWGCLLGGFVPAVLPVPGSFHSATAELDKLRAVWTLLAQPTILATRTTCAALGEHLEHGARAVRVLALELLREHAPEGKPHRAQPDDVAFLSLSSGSTGVPKCIQLTHRNILSRGRAASALCQQSASDVILNWLPFDHIGSISDWHLRCIELGCSMVYCSKESVLGDPLEWLRMLERHRITHSWAPNFAYALINSALARSQGERWDLSQLKFLLTAGEAVSSRTLEELLSGLKAHGLPPTAARSAFGMAELGSGITYSQPTAERPVQALSIDRASLCVSLRELPDQHARAISFSALGPPIAGMSLRIVDGQGELVPERTIGKLHVRGSALSPGYYRNPEAKQAFLPDGWFDTGDEGFVDQGELYLTGRSKDCLILHGANYFPIEIEKVVEELPGVTVSFTAAYTVRPQHSEREQAALFFVLEPGHELGATLGEIRQRVSQRIGIQLDYIVPVEQADVPKTAIGKIQRKQLAARFEALGFAEQLRQADLTLGNERTLPDWFASQSLRPVALRDTWRAPARRFLVLADACGLAECLVDALGEERCLLVRASEARVSQVCLRAELQPGSLLEQAFSELAEASELELHVIDLSGYGRAPEPWQLASGELLRGAIDAINELLAEIARHPERARIAKLSVVASHSQRVDARDRLCPVRSLLPALLAAAALELPALRVAQVDLEPCAADDALALTARASLLARELQHDAPERELCYRGSQRYALRLQHGRPVDVAPAALARGGLYVVTGGLGGLGVELARYLLTQLDARVLLVGKSALDEPRSARLDALRALGEVAYAAVDVADASRLQAAVESAERTWEGPLSGVFHLAGVYREASDLAEHGATSWQVMRAKVLGALAIQSLLAARPSALVVHYSSLASVLPNERAAAYAAANRFLDGLSHHQRDELGLASYALGFSAWHEVGMNAEGLHEPLLRRRGLYAIAPSAGLSSLLMVLGGAPSNTLVGVRADSPALRHRFDGPALPLQELRGFYTQSTSAVKLPRQLLAQGSPLSLERRQSMPLDERQQLDREQLHRLLLDQGELRVAPENALEEQLLGLWKRVLKLQNLGVCCDFFMQGGHSLLAAELVHDINQCFGNKFPLSLIFEARTVREQARSIDSGKHGTGVSVVPLQPLGSEPPLFCICGINIYQELASALAPEIPVYGVLLPVEGELLEGQSVELNVPAMARQYVSAIRGKQASGPYRVLGLSFGGALAYEVAQQLRRAGAEVSLLTMLDFVHPAGRRRSLLKLASHELSRLKRDRGLWLRRARELTSRVLPQAAHESQSVEPQRAREGVRQSAYAKAWAEYEPSLCPYPGKVLVIRAEDQSMWDGFDVAPDLGWSRFVSELQHRDVPGDHLSILRAPNVARLAGHLREALHAAGSKSPAQAALPSELSTRDVGTLREQIDELDRSLLELLGQRMTVVSQLASTKHEQGLPVRDGERERELLDSRAVWARQQQLPDELVRPLFGVIMRASRERQVAQMAALTAPDEHKTIAVIGAHGGMGKRMCALFEGLGHRVLAVDRTTSLTAEQAAQRADVTLIAVPITATEQVLREVGPHVPAHGLLMDISSLKQRPLETMLACTAASVLGTHPMFGPLVGTLHGQRVVLCPGRGDAWLRWAERTFQAGGLVTAQSTAEEHDRAMAEVQVLSHFQTEVMGLTLARLGTPLEQSLRFSTPPYLMELYMAARHFSQDSSLYSSISMDNPRTEQITQAFLDATSSLREILLTRDKEGLASVFTQVRSFLGSFGPHAVEQSKHLVASLAEPS